MPKRFLVFVAIAVSAFIAYTQRDDVASAPPDTVATEVAADAGDVLQRAFDERRSNLQVRGSGIVERILSDDNDGSRHQRFVIRTSTGQTVLIAHNIDLAPRVAPLAEGDRIEFNGEYEWNEKGGVIHWTHRDPQGRHEHGWIRRGGTTFQ